jgi:tetratricopeptide (TPR) repeat protein
MLPDPLTQGTWNWALRLLEYWRGRSDEAISVLRAMPEPAARIVTSRMFNVWIQAMALGQKGEYEPALRLLEEVAATSEHVGDVLVRARAFNTLGWIYAELEDPQRARHWNQASLDFLAGLTGFPNPDVEQHARVNLGDNLRELGRPLEAEEQYRRAEAVASSPNPKDHWMAWRFSEHLFHSYGQLWLARGDLTRAAAYADRCLENATSTGSLKNVVKARRLRGQIRMADGRLAEAEAELASAIEAAEQIGNPPQRWKTHAAIGDLRMAQGRTDDAHRAYGQALAVIDATAAGLHDDELRKTFTDSAAIARVRQAAAGGH